MVLFLAGAQKIPKELFESARVDGAAAWQETRHVLVPGIRREIVFALVLTVINALRTFDISYVLTKGGPGLQTDVPSYEVYRQAFGLGNVGQAAAFGVALTVMLLVIVVPLTRLEGRGSGARDPPRPHVLVRDPRALLVPRDLPDPAHGGRRARAGRRSPTGSTIFPAHPSFHNISRVWTQGQFGNAFITSTTISVAVWWSRRSAPFSRATPSGRCASPAAGRSSTCSCWG